MGIWDWDDVENKIVQLDSAPPAAKLAAAIISDETYDDEWERKVFDRTGLPQVGLVEWSLCSEIESIFSVLRDAGSQLGWVVELGEGHTAKDYAREITLSASTAEQIDRDLAMENPMAFVDDQQLCVLVSYFSDYALICLREDIFETWLANHPLDLTLWADEERYPSAKDLKSAQELALRRNAAWDAQLQATKGD